MLENFFYKDIEKLMHIHSNNYCQTSQNCDFNVLIGLNQNI